MTEENNVSYVVVNPIPRGGSSYFFDFINNQLSDIAEQMDNNDAALIEEMRLGRGTMIQSKDEIKSSASRVISLIRNRVEKRKADMKNKAVAAKVKLLDKKKAAAMFGAVIKAVASYDSKMGVKDRIDQAQKGVNDKYNQKIDAELDKVVDVEKEAGSIRKELKGIGNNIGGYLKAAFGVKKSKNQYLKKKHDLTTKRIAIGLLGVTTAPIKSYIEGAKYAYREGSEFVGKAATKLNKMGIHARWVTRDNARKFKAGAKSVYAFSKERVIQGATAVKDGVVKGAKKAKKKGLHARWVARDTAKKFKSNASTKWAAGKEAFGNFCEKIKEAPGKTWASLKGCYETTAKKAKEAYNNSNVGKFVKAVRTGYQAGMAAYATAKLTSR